MEHKFKGTLRGIDMINASSEQMKEALQMQVKMAGRDCDPAKSYKDVTMMPLNEFKDFLAAFNKIYNVKEESDFLEAK